MKPSTISLPVISLLLCLAGLDSDIADAGRQHYRGQLAGKLQADDGLRPGTPPAALAVHPEDAQCLEECMRQGQMQAVAPGVIRRQCRRECDLTKALSLLDSSMEGDYAKGVKALCAINDPRTVSPLVRALERDFRERTGLWAWIIPALGASRDRRALPVLARALTIMDRRWPGREMAARALGDLGDPDAIPHLLAAAQRGDTHDAAIQALARYRDIRVIPALILALGPEEERQTREAAAAGLERLGSMAVPEIARAFSQDFHSEYPERQKRLVLCRLLGASGDKRALDALRKARNDHDKAVRECVRAWTR